MSDFADKPQTEEPPPVNTDDLIAFFNKCDNRIRPAVVRPEVMMPVLAGMNEEAYFDKLPRALGNAIKYSDSWLKKFDGIKHTVRCCTCSTAVECEPEKAHTEVGAFMVSQPLDLNPEIGGLVCVVCNDCAEKTDDELYAAFGEALHGRFVTMEPNAPVPEGGIPAGEARFEHEEVINFLDEGLSAAFDVYEKRGYTDFGAYLEQIASIVEAAREQLARKLATPGDETGGVQSDETGPVSKDDVNLLVGQD